MLSGSAILKTGDSPPDQYRVALLLSRWGRRTAERLLQRRAAALGRDLILHQAFHHLRHCRAVWLHRWHREKTAELHQWRTLMRLVLCAWRGWYALLTAGVARRDAALQRRADRLCAWCLGGWVLYVHQRWRARGGLVHYANALMQRCLSLWATWVESRHRKRPERERLIRVAAARALRGAWRRWTAAAERRGTILLECAMAARLASEAEMERAVAKWAVHRLDAARRATQQRRAYIFMGTRLLGRVAAAWRGMLSTRKPLLTRAHRPMLRVRVTSAVAHSCALRSRRAASRACSPHSSRCVSPCD